MIVLPDGELDIESVTMFEARLATAAASEGVERVVLDLRSVTFIDSSGLRAILGGLRSLEPSSRLEVVPGSESVMRIFEVAGVMDELPVVHADGTP